MISNGIRIILKRRIVQAASLVMIAYLASRLLGLVREMVIAERFGTSAELGAYLAAFRIPDLIFQLLAGGALGSSFIPVFAVYLANGQEEEGWRLASAIYNLVGLATTVCAALAFVFAPYLAAGLVPGFDADMQALTGRLMRVMLLTPIIFGLSGISMAILNAYQHFLLPAIAPIVYNLSIIAGALLLTPRLGIYGLAVGVVVGAFSHFLIQVPGLLKRRWHYLPTLGLHLPGVREVIRLLIPRLLGLAVMQVNFVVNVILASSLAEGSVASLNYAFLIMMLPQGAVAMAIATAAFPTFSDLVARQQAEELRGTLAAILRLIAFLTIPAAVGLLLMRYPLIRVLLERGQFTSASTETVAWALQFYLLGLPAYAIVEVISRAFYALHDTRTPVAVGAATVILNIVLSLVLVHYLAHGGLALANALAVNAEMVGLLWIMRRRIAGLQEKELLVTSAQSLMAAAAMALGLASFLKYAAGASSWSLVIGGLVIGGAVYLGISWALYSIAAKTLSRWMHCLRMRS